MEACREAYGKALLELKAQHPELVVLDADLAEATYTKYFRKAYPDDFFECGIAEQNMMSVAAGLATRAQIQVSYAIGVADPMNITVNTYGTGVISDERISEIVSDRKIFDLRPGGIIQMLDLRRPIYSKTAAYGHFGREEPEFTWEKTDKVEALRAAAGL